MLPLLENLAVELAGKAEIVKFNCNKHNKELGQSLGIKVAPTFHVYREEKQVGIWGAGVQHASRRQRHICAKLPVALLTLRRSPC